MYEQENIEFIGSAEIGGRWHTVVVFAADEVTREYCSTCNVTTDTTFAEWREKEALTTYGVAWTLRKAQDDV